MPNIRCPEDLGARTSWIVGLMNYVITQATETNDLSNVLITQDRSLATIRGEIVGAALTVRQRFRKTPQYRLDGERDLMAASLSGNGWLASFNVGRKRPTSLPEDEWSDGGSLVIINMKPPHHANKSNRSIHTFSIISPEEFRTQMAVLRMFSHEWDERE